MLTIDPSKIDPSKKEILSKVKLAIATPTYEMKMYEPYVTARDATLRLLWELGVEVTPVPLTGDSYVQRAKNTLLTDVHRLGKYTHVLFIDSDMSWSPEAVVVMLACDKEVVGGTYPMKNNWGNWGVEIETARLEDGRQAPIGIPDIPLFKAKKLPGGFLLIRMDAIDRMRKAYPDMTYWTQVREEGSREHHEIFTPKEYYNFFEVTFPVINGRRQFLGEDHTFIKRYIEAGGVPWLYPNIQFGHVGYKVWEGNYLEYLMSLPGGVNDPERGVHAEGVDQSQEHLARPDDGIGLQEQSQSMELAMEAISKRFAIQKPSELAGFLEFIKDKPLKTVVEIGTAKGGVFWALCQVMDEEATIVSIDLPGGSGGGGYSLSEQEKFKGYAKQKQRPYFLREDSHLKSTRNRLLKILDGKKVDLLFIDGDHSYEGVKKDWEMFSPIVAEGGIVGFHDICFHPYREWCQVDRLWKELKLSQNTLEIIDPIETTWGGIGIIVKGEKCKTIIL